MISAPILRFEEELKRATNGREMCIALFQLFIGIKKYQQN